LPSANASCYRARSGLSPPSYRPCRAHNRKQPQAFELAAAIQSIILMSDISLKQTGCRKWYTALQHQRVLRLRLPVSCPTSCKWRKFRRPDRQSLRWRFIL